MPRPTGWEISLHTGDPGVDGLDNEVADVEYARQSVEFVVDDTSPDTPFAQNDTHVVFPPAAEEYTVTHLVVWDTDGNILVPQPLRVPRTILVAEQAQIATGEIKIGAL